MHYLFGEFHDGELDLEGSEPHLNSVALLRYPARDIVELFDRVGRAWRDPGFEPRQKCLELLPDLVGFSPTMVERGLEELTRLLDRSTLMSKMRYELGRSAVLDRWVWREGYQGYVRALPLGVVTHVSPGNVFLGAADSLVHGLLTKNINLVKVASADPIFPLLFARSVKEFDRDGVVSQSFAVLAFERQDQQVESWLKERSDGIVVWGGQGAVDAWRAGLSPGCKFIPYGPRFSFAVITRQGMEQTTLADLALDVVMWEQRACASPQVLFLEAPEDPGQEEEAILEELGRELERLAEMIPAAELDFHQKVEVRKERELALELERRGRGRCLGPDGRFRWSVIWRAWDDHHGHPLNRTLVVVPFQRRLQIKNWLRPHRHLLQSAGLAVGHENVREWASSLARLGVHRVTELGKMHLAKHGAPHDGSFQLGELVRWSTIESVAHRFDAQKRLQPDPPSKTRSLLALIDYARERSPFYEKRLPPFTLESTIDLTGLPLLDSETLRAHTPPAGRDLLTAPLEGAYVFASGGSTGAPKFSLYTYEEWEEVTDTLCAIYQVAGVRPGDTVGNLFMAGNLWTSFLAATEALEKLGCVTLPIAGNVELGQTLTYLELFKPSVLLGLPSLLIRLAEEVSRRKLELEVPLILYGGEHFSREARAFLRKALGARTVVSAGYASVDAGPVGYQTPSMQGGTHQLLYNYQYLEFVDPENQQPVEEGQVGEIVITCLKRRLMPLIRYRTGDLGRWTDVEHRIFELKGRVGDRVRVGGSDIYPEDIAQALDALPGVSRLFQLVLGRSGIKDELLVLTERNGWEEPPTVEEIEKAVVESSPELSMALEGGWLGKFSVELREQDGLPRVARTGKIQRVVDNRV